MFRKPLGHYKNSTNQLILARNNNGLLVVYGLASAEVSFLIVENFERHGQFLAVSNYEGMKNFYKEKCGDYPRDLLPKDVKAVAKYIKKKGVYDPRKLMAFIQKKTGLNCLIGTVPFKDNDERFAARNLPFMSFDKMEKHLKGE